MERMSLIATLTAGAVVLFAATAMAAVKPGDKAPDFTLKSADGETHSLSDFKGKTVVLEWINFGCPFVRKHYATGNMQSLQEKYLKEGVVWLAICSSAPGKQGYYAEDALGKKLRMERFSGTAYLLDEDGKVGKAYGAKRTPEMFVIGPEGEVLYHGAIDDKSSADPESIEGATNYVAQALDATLADEPVPTRQSEPYGCSVKY